MHHLLAALRWVAGCTVQQAGPQPAHMLLAAAPAPPRAAAPQDQLAEVPVYAHPKAVVCADGSVEALEITYITIYAHNGPYRVGGAPFLQTGAHDVRRGWAGSLAAYGEDGCSSELLLAPHPALRSGIPAHPLPRPSACKCVQGDIEHCTARVDHRTGDLLGFWYNAHRSRDGCWVAASQVGGRNERFAVASQEMPTERCHPPCTINFCAAHPPCRRHAAATAPSLPMLPSTGMGCTQLPAASSATSSLATTCAAAAGLCGARAAWCCCRR